MLIKAFRTVFVCSCVSRSLLCYATHTVYDRLSEVQYRLHHGAI